MFCKLRKSSHHNPCQTKPGKKGYIGQGIVPTYMSSISQGKRYGNRYEKHHRANQRQSIAKHPLQKLPQLWPP